jgi:DNA-binding transcriptional ArsR family regulator
VTDARALASVACLLGDESRAAMCLALLDGGAWTVSELAEAASVGRAAASEHVARLVAGGLVTTETQGRHKFVRLAGPRVAELVELLSGFGTPAPARSLAAVRERTRLAAARTCYDHLAGRLGVAVHDALVGRRMLTHRGGLGLTPRGRDWFADLGVDLAGLEAQRRALLRECVDLTERTPHLAGSLGAALCDEFLARDWVRRRDRTRTLEVTPLGERAVADLLGLAPADLAVG